MRFVKDETVRIKYIAKRMITGLTDVVIKIWDPTGTVKVNNATMTELAEGIYYYDYRPSRVGTYLVHMSCASQPKDEYLDFVVVNRSSTYVEMMRGGGMVQEVKKTVVQDSIWTKDEKKIVFQDLKSIRDQLKELLATRRTLDSQSNNIIKLDSMIQDIDKKLGDLRSVHAFNESMDSELRMLKEDISKLKDWVASLLDPEKLEDIISKEGVKS